MLFIWLTTESKKLSDIESIKILVKSIKRVFLVTRRKTHVNTTEIS